MRQTVVASVRETHLYQNTPAERGEGIVRDAGPELPTFQLLSLDRITERLPVRRLNPVGVIRLKESLQRMGFLESFPLIVTPLDHGTYLLIGGNHRYGAALAIGMRAVPCIITRHLSAQEQFTRAWQSNNATETLIPSTLVTYAEFVWTRAAEGYTQQEIAEMLSWSRDKVAKYMALNEIEKEAWKMIVTTFEQIVTPSDERVVTPDVTGVTFTENLLRDIIPLSCAQQLELVQAVAAKDIKKARFTDLAKAY